MKAEKFLKNDRAARMDNLITLERVILKVKSRNNKY